MPGFCHFVRLLAWCRILAAACPRSRPDTAAGAPPSTDWPTRHPTAAVADNDPVNDLAPLLTPEGRALLDEVRDTDPAQELAVATRLRREHPAELVSAALGQARLRQRAVVKFGAEDAGRMFFTPNGVEQ